MVQVRLNESKDKQQAHLGMRPDDIGDKTKLYEVGRELASISYTWGCRGKGVARLWRGSTE